MTIFPTHKTELKTKLPRYEVINRLENNDFYALGYCYELEKGNADYSLIPKRDNIVYRSPKSSSPPIVALSIEQKSDNTNVALKFSPLKKEIIRAFWGFALLLLAQIFVFALYTVHNGIDFAFFVPIIAGAIGYLLFFLAFSFEVLSIRKQIEEAIEAEIHEVTEDEMSKLQKWYEKKR